MQCDIRDIRDSTLLFVEFQTYWGKHSQDVIKKFHVFTVDVFDTREHGRLSSHPCSRSVNRGPWTRTVNG